ncbi:MAG: hypothetical protein Q9160_000567 [Pyrenula sp. 1 TL-2023]
MLPSARVYALGANSFFQTARLRSPSDTDFAAIFKRVFSADKGDETKYSKQDRPTPKQGQDDEDMLSDDEDDGQKPFDFVDGILGDLADNWLEANGDDGRLRSDVRFYCDQDARWVKKKAASGTEYWLDEANLMKRTIDKIPGCRRPATGRTLLGITYRDAIPYNGGNSKYKVQNHDRATITWTHTTPFRTLDVGGKEQAYGWDNIVKKNTADSLNNADNYVWLAIWALLAERNVGGGGGFTLTRLGNGANKPDDQKSPAEKKAETDAQNGMIQLVHDITKRRRWMPEEVLERRWRA